MSMHLREYATEAAVSLYHDQHEKPDLIIGVLSGDLEKVKLALDVGANPNCFVGNDYHIIHDAVEKGNIDVLDALLTAGANINIKTWNLGHTPLHIACKLGNAVMVEALIKRGAEIDILNKQAEEPLNIAVRLGHLKCCELLIKGNADVNMSYLGNSMPTPLISACKNSFYDIAKLLLDNGANVNVSQDTTPLICSLSCPKILKLLLERKADVNGANSPGNRLDGGNQGIHEAAYKGLYQSVEILLEAGANPISINSRGFKPIDLVNDRLKFYINNSDVSKNKTAHFIKRLQKIQNILTKAMDAQRFNADQSAMETSAEETKMG